MTDMNLTENEKNMLLKLSIDEEGINNNNLGSKEQGFLNGIRLCTKYLNEKYIGNNFKYLYFAPADMFNRRSELVFTENDKDTYSVFYDSFQNTIQDNYFKKLLAKRYDDWFIDTIKKEFPESTVVKIETLFPDFHGKELVGTEPIEKVIEMRSELERNASVYVSGDSETEKLREFAYKYGLYGTYRIMKDDKEIDFFNTFDIE